MATENFYELGGMVYGHVTGLTDGSNFDVTPADWTTRNVEIGTYIVGAACDIKYLTDSGGDFGSPDSNITLDSFDGNGISEGNATPLQRNRTALRVTNTSGGPADFAVVGRVREPYGGDD